MKRFAQTLIAAFSVVFAVCTPALGQSESLATIEKSIAPLIRFTNRNLRYFSIEERMAYYGVPGLSIAFVNSGELAWLASYGFTDKSESQVVSIDTFFPAGSISKPVAAAVSLQLVQEGKVDFDTNINTYLSTWKIPDNEYTTNEKVTLRRLLNHTAGTTVWGFPGYSYGEAIPTIEDILAGRGNTPAIEVDKIPGESWRYSGGGYTVIQRLISELESEPFDQVVQKRLFDRIGMNRSTFQNPLPIQLRTDFAKGYRRNGDQIPGGWQVYPELAAAGLWTTPQELAKFIIELHNSEDSADGILSQELVQEMLTPGLNSYGLGPVISQSGEVWSHNGAHNGYRARIIAWKSTNSGLVIMTNAEHDALISELSLAIANEYNLPISQPPSFRLLEISEELGEFLEGKYSIDEVRYFNVSFEDATLNVNSEFIGLDGAFLRISENSYINENTGIRIDFRIDGSEVLLVIDGNSIAKD